MGAFGLTREVRATCCRAPRRAADRGTRGHPSRLAANAASHLRMTTCLWVILISSSPVRGSRQDLAYQDLAYQDLAYQDLAYQDLAYQDLAYQAQVNSACRSSPSAQASSAAPSASPREG